MDIVSRAIISKGIGNIIDKLRLVGTSKEMVSVMKNVFMTVIALCGACRECGVTG
jgi:hypothetical protein